MAAKYKAQRAGRKKSGPVKAAQLSGHSPQPEGRVAEQETCMSDSQSQFPEHKTSPPDSTVHCIDLQQRIQDIRTAVAQTTAPHAEDYFEHLYYSLTKNAHDYQLRLSIISDALKLLEAHSLQARTLEAELLQGNGVGNLLSQGQELTQKLRDMTRAAEELWCFIVYDADTAKLIQQHSRGDLRFQQPTMDK